jgi:hypothetical protein
MDHLERTRITTRSQTLRDKSATLRLLCAKTCRRSLAVVADSKAAIARSRRQLMLSPLLHEDRWQIPYLRTHAL